MISPPQSEAELLKRAANIAGRRIADLAGDINVNVPENLHTKKGWVGGLIEKILGADAGSLSGPDFQQLGIELKTLPLNAQGQVQESTFVCVASLINPPDYCWQDSPVYKKLRCVLWVPVEASHDLILRERRIGNAFIWRPDSQEMNILKQDWLGFMELIQTGQLDQLHADMGQYLQIRPKAANAKSLCDAYDENGNLIQTLPRGFYLRPSVTNQLIQHYCL